ncbi:unnamed protein product [Lactuca saligna]|uniref:MULE transposase domain-containing protein n=1 Tax=Lactuca saligna TaxID=75948 RepID=A0AA35YRZ1_LACSI|nr:unnamed protein product [Lactuca saligna]
MIDRENFSIIAQAADVTNVMNIVNKIELNEILEDGIGDGDDEEASFDNNVEVPSTFTNMEGTNLTIDDHWIMTQSTSALQKFNPGTRVESCVSRSTDDEVEFRRVFWAFAPSIKGFQYCRLVISIDDTHLYGKYKGKMLIAMGGDVKDRESICLISDRHGGIFKAVNEHGSPWLVPCGFHSNFYDKFRNLALKALAYRAESQNQIRKFNSIMEEIGKLNPCAQEWLESHPLNRWTLVHDGGRRRPLGSISQAHGDAHTPHVVVKQVALMAKASAHSLRSFK